MFNNQNPFNLKIYKNTIEDKNLNSTAIFCQFGMLLSASLTASICGKYYIKLSNIGRKCTNAIKNKAVRKIIKDLRLREKVLTVCATQIRKAANNDSN